MVRRGYIIVVAVALLSVIAGCDSSVDPGVSNNPDSFNQSFFWDKTKGKLDYITKDINGILVANHSLSFTQSGDSIIVQVVAVEGQGSSYSYNFSYKETSGTTTLRETSSFPLFRLPSNWQISGNRESIKYTVSCLVAYTPTVAFCGTEEGKILRFDFNAFTWTPVQFEARAPIKNIVHAEGSTILFASTESDIWMSTDSGIRWSALTLPITGTITDMVATIGGELIVASGRDLHSVSFPYTGVWTKSDSSFEAEITALSANIHFLYIGTSGGHIYKVLGSQGKYIQFNQVLTGMPVVDIVAMNGPGLNAVVLFNYPWILYDFGGEFNLWQFNDIPNVAVSTDNPNEFLLGFKTKGLYSVELFRGEASTGATFDYVDMIDHLTASYHIAKTNRGMMLSENGAVSWVSIEDGLESPANFVGLSLVSGSKKVSDGTWDVGSIEDVMVGKTYTVKAKVLQFLNELHTADKTHMYKNVYSVHYTLYENDVERNDLMNWKVYFAQGVGPVLIEEYIGTQLILTTYLDNTNTPA